MGAADLPEGARLTAAAATRFHPDTVVLDVDGVLVDVEPSFREAVRQTVPAVQRLMGVERPWTPSRVQIRQLKRAGGFNDDIHSSIALAAVGAGGAAGRLDALLAAVEAAGGGLAGLRAVAPELPRVDGGLCVRVFDEHYWGADRFRALFGEEPRHVTAAAGLVEAERPLVDPDLPGRLRETAVVGRVALITGRTPPELEAALDLSAGRPATSTPWSPATSCGSPTLPASTGCSTPAARAPRCTRGTCGTTGSWCGGIAPSVPPAPRCAASSSAARPRRCGPSGSTSPCTAPATSSPCCAGGRPPGLGRASSISWPRAWRITSTSWRAPSRSVRAVLMLASAAFSTVTSGVG